MRKYQLIWATAIVLATTAGTALLWYRFGDRASGEARGDEESAVAALTKSGAVVIRDTIGPGKPVTEVRIYNLETCAPLKELVALKQLQSLTVKSCKDVGPGCWQALAELKQLRSLRTAGPWMRDADVKELVGFTQLQTLQLMQVRVTDAGVKELAGLKSLQTLDLSSTQVTDGGLKELVAHTELQTLVLIQTDVTDAGLKEIAALKQLQNLYIFQTKVTDAGVADLKRALPKCKISLTALVEKF